MNTAMLSDGKLVSAEEYVIGKHGTQLFCIDKRCRVPVIFMPATANTRAYFKTTGKNDSSHSEECGFYRPLNFKESVEKVNEYYQELTSDNKQLENLIRVNLNKIDPDYTPKQNEQENSKQDNKQEEKIKIKSENKTPGSISSLKSIVKLITSHEPDILSTVLIGIRGYKVPLSSVVIDHIKAHQLLWESERLRHEFFVFGHIESVQRREKVIYINFTKKNDISFTLVIFEKHFKHFTYSDEQLIGKNCLVYGLLRKNTYKEKNITQMIIKSNNYLEFLTLDD
ncbi:hypothetical protein [Bacillus swezeyi]|uniref:Uncharacterized protein n=1 Tax=Bacillus swezeyi TaxID=1925020 RepID=A0A5M8RHM8_9BACI|nr:hypothetical protein [Bacillus swezeyi]KAA6446948.1 hypothetical protein DX927_23135 [Bacillus swezeyi]KAA6471516.1 hypothetical protein DX928_23375 [Bacillus swezeyi]